MSAKTSAAFCDGGFQEPLRSVFHEWVTLNCRRLQAAASSSKRHCGASKRSSPKIVPPSAQNAHRNLVTAVDWIADRFRASPNPIGPPSERAYLAGHANRRLAPETGSGSQLARHPGELPPGQELAMGGLLAQSWTVSRPDSRLQVDFRGLPATLQTNTAPIILAPAFPG
jgi:hypothetical protein